MLHGAASETKNKSLRSPSESSSQLQEATMEHSLEAWPWGQDANSMSSPLSLYTSSWVRRTAGTYTHPHTWANKHQWVLTDDSTQILQAPTQATFLFMSWAALTNVHSSKKLGRNVRGASSPMFMLKKVVKNSSNWMINDCVFTLLPLFPSTLSSAPASVPLSFFPSSVNSKYLSGGLPGVYAVLDVSNPRVFLQRVDGFQDVFSPVFHLWKQPKTAVIHRAVFSAPRQSRKRKPHQKTGEVELDFSKVMVYLICIPDVF